MDIQDMLKEPPKITVKRKDGLFNKLCQNNQRAICYMTINGLSELKPPLYLTAHIKIHSNWIKDLSAKIIKLCKDKVKVKEQGNSFVS